MTQAPDTDGPLSRGPLWLHPSHRPAMRNVGLVLATLLAGLLTAASLPALEGIRGIAHYLPLHALLETAAIVVAMMVFAVSLSSQSLQLPANVVFLGCVFLGVALLDFSHLLSFAGMPDYVTPSGPEKSIAFWLAARLLTAMALLAVALSPWRSQAAAMTRGVLLAAVLVVVAVFHGVILWHPELLPRTFIPGEGLTPLKRHCEYTLIAANLAAAAVLWWRMRAPQALSAADLFGAAGAAAISEAFFTIYTDVTDAYNLLGHVYKVVAFLLVYRAVFVVNVQWPYDQLRAAQAQVQATLSALPDLSFEVDDQGRVREFHSHHGEMPLLPVDALLNRPVAESLPPQAADAVMAAIRQAGRAGRSQGQQFPWPQPQGGERWYELSVARKAAGSSATPRYVVLARDISPLKDNEAELRALAQRANALLELPRIAETTDEKGFMQRGQEMAEDLTGSEISFIHFVNKGGEEIELVTWSRRTLEHYCTAAYDSHYPVSQAGIWADALRAAKPVVFNDYASHPHKHGLPEGHSPLRRLISVPVIENGEVVMLTGVGNKHSDYTDQDVQTVQLISQELWGIVQRNRSRNKLTRLSRALDRSSNEIYILDPRTLRILDANQGALDKTGYTHKELLGLTALDLKPELTSASQAALLAPLMAGHKDHLRFEAQHRRKDGGLYPVEVHVELTQDEPALLMQVALDITERRKAEQAVLEALARVDRLAQHVPGMFFQFHLRPDGTSCFPYCSPGIQDIYGVRPEQVAEDAAVVVQANHPQDLPQLVDSIAASARTLSVWRAQFRVFHADGRLIWVEGEASPEAAPDGGVLWHGHARDITERKKTETLVHEQLDELRRWQQMMLGREARIISVKQEVNALLAQAGQPPRYADYAASEGLVGLAPQQPLAETAQGEA